MVRPDRFPWSGLPVTTAVLIAASALGGQPLRAQEIPLELRGTVVSEETGRPLARVLVSIGPLSPPVVSETDGSYVVRTRQRTLNELTGVQAFLPGYLPEERFEILACHSMVVLPGDRSPACVVRLNFLMRPASPVVPSRATCNVSGRVQLEGSLEAAHVMITVDGTKIGTLSNSEGRYLLIGVPAGLQRIAASGAGLVTERRNVVVRCGADEEIALAFLMRPMPIS